MEKEASDPGKTKMIVLIIIGVFFVVVAVCVIYVWQARGIPPVEFLENAFTDNYAKNSQSPKNNSNNNEEGVNSLSGPLGSAGGGSGSGSGGAASSGNSSCHTEQISYSIQNINKYLACVTQMPLYCAKQNLNCSAEVHNLDDNVTGIFNLEILFFNKRIGITNPLFKIPKKISLGPGEFNVIYGSYNLSFNQVSASLPPDLDCFFNTITVPTKQVCS